jgi:hypothetical protein
MLTKDDIQQLGDLIDTKLDQKLEQKLEPIKSELLHLKTAMKSVATKEDIELEAKKTKSEIQADIRILNASLITKVNKHTKSIHALHEGTGIPDPHTH